MRKIEFQTLTLKNFKSHRDLTVEFGDTTQITGDNAQGKSTIPESIPWLLYNTDTLGSKLDPTPVTYESEETMVSLLLSIDGKQLLLGKALAKGKAEYYINEAPKSATAFNELVKSIFDKDLFFSLYNPNYFFTLTRNEQRAMILQYVPSMANKEVLKNLPETQAEKLGELLKKNNLNDIEETHKKNKTKKDKAYIAAQSRTRTLKEQQEQLPTVNVPIESIKVELAQIDKQVREKENLMDNAIDKNQAFNNTQSKINALQDQIEISKEHWPLLKNEVIEDSCKTCKRPLDEESVEAVKVDKEKRKAEYQSKHNELLKQRAELKAQLEKLKLIDISELREEIREIDESGHSLREALRTHSQFELLQEQVNAAVVDEKETLDSLNTSIFILDSIKAFRAKEAELQAEKVQALFTTLSIRLFKKNKGDGEYKPDFEIEMDGKGYSKLSLSEGIRAGLELREVLSKQSEVISPVFIDNAESITKFKEPTGQLIISRVVAGQELKIERLPD